MNIASPPLSPSLPSRSLSLSPSPPVSPLSHRYMKSVAMHLVPIDLFYWAFKIIPTPFFQRVFVMLDDDGR